MSEAAEETVEIVGACKLMDGFFLGDAICAEVSPIKTRHSNRSNL